MQDAHSIAVFDDRVRICAIDGCTPVAQTPSVAGVNGASYAAGLLSYALLEPSDVTGIIESCNAHLYALGEHVSARSRPQASVAVVDLFPHKSGGFRLAATRPETPRCGLPPKVRGTYSAAAPALTPWCGTPGLLACKPSENNTRPRTNCVILKTSYSLTLPSGCTTHL